MAFSKVSNYANDDENIEYVQLTLDKAYKSKISVSLTEMATTTVPAIAEGSCMDNNGGLYDATSETAISLTDPVTTATVADGDIYICVIPTAGSAAGATTDATGYSIGATSITLASAGTGTILVGDRVQFVGDNTRYAVTVGDADVSNGGTITIQSPGLIQAIPASTTAITLYGGSLTSAFTATTPTWSDTKQGWYGTGGQANYRYIAAVTKAGASYTAKRILIGGSDELNSRLFDPDEV